MPRRSNLEAQQWMAGRAENWDIIAYNVPVITLELDQPLGRSSIVSVRACFDSSHRLKLTSGPEQTNKMARRVSATTASERQFASLIPDT